MVTLYHIHFMKYVEYAESNVGSQRNAECSPRINRMNVPNTADYQNWIQRC